MTLTYATKAEAEKSARALSIGRTGHNTRIEWDSELGWLVYLEAKQSFIEQLMHKHPDTTPATLEDTE